MPNRTAKPFVSMSSQATAYKALDAAVMPAFPAGQNVIGKKREIPAEDTAAGKDLLGRNEALALNRFDEKFSNINTSHPCRAAVFAGTIPALMDQKKRQSKKK